MPRRGNLFNFENGGHNFSRWRSCFQRLFQYFTWKNVTARAFFPPSDNKQELGGPTASFRENFREILSRNSIPCVKFIMPRVVRISVPPSSFLSFLLPPPLSKFFVSSVHEGVKPFKPHNLHSFTLLWIFSGNNIALGGEKYSRWRYLFRGLILFIACEKMCLIIRKFGERNFIWKQNWKTRYRRKSTLQFFKQIARRAHLFFMMARVLMSTIKISKLFFFSIFFFLIMK